MSSLQEITDVQMRGLIKPHKWKCPILCKFHEGYVIHVWQFRYCHKRRQWESRKWTGPHVRGTFPAPHCLVMQNIGPLKMCVSLFCSVYSKDLTVTTAPVTILYVVFLVSSNHRSHDTVNIALLIFTLGTNFNISFFPEEHDDNFKCVISQQSIIISMVSISSEMSPRRIPQLDFIYHKSTLAKVMTWCHRATSHWFNHCWPRFISPNGITRRQWIILLLSVSTIILHLYQALWF